MNKPNLEMPEEFLEFPEACAALATTAAAPAPFLLRQKMLDSAFARRSANTAHAPRPPAYDAYREQVDALATLLETHTPIDWLAIVAEGMSVREMLIHLSVVDDLAAASLNGVMQIDNDVEQLTRRAIAAFPDVDDVDVCARWRAAAVALYDAARRVSLDDDVVYLGLPLLASQVMIDRAFETWLHAQDIRRSFGLSVVPPVDGSLGLMMDFAARMLPLVLDGALPSTTARLVADSGLGSWLVPFGRDLVPAEPTVTLTVDAVSFCLLVGDRLSIDELAYEVSGDAESAMMLLERASLLARF